MYKQHLQVWFKHVEFRAWKWVKALYDSPPSSIFLVTGQILTPEYAISHQEEGSSACEVVVEAKVGIPQMVDINLSVGYALGKVTVSSGFDVIKKKEGDKEDEELYSIFLDIVPSRPMRRLAVGDRDAKKLLETMQ